MPFGSVLSALQYPVATQSAFGLGVKFPMEGYFGMGFGKRPVFRPFSRKPIAFLLKVVGLQDSNRSNKCRKNVHKFNVIFNMPPKIPPVRACHPRI